MPSPLHAIFGGGAVASFSVDPQLPEGLNFTNGTIYGTQLSILQSFNITSLQLIMEVVITSYSTSPY